MQFNAILSVPIKSWTKNFASPDRSENPFNFLFYLKGNKKIATDSWKKLQKKSRLKTRTL
jgi:hypothetical protein